MIKKASVRAACFLAVFFTLLGLAADSAWAQSRAALALSQTTKNTLARTLHFSVAEQIPTATFLQTYRQILRLSSEDELKPFDISSDDLGQTRHRLQQYYKGIALADRSFLLHEKNGKVFLAHGEIVSDLDLEVAPALSEPQALRFALDHVGAQAYMWEDPANEIFLQREQNDPAATFRPKGELQISAGHEARGPQDFRLVYRFDIYAEKPLGRYDVDVDAKTGAIVKVSSRLYETDIPSQGMSVYNGAVAMTADEVTDDTYRLRERGRGTGIETYDMQRTTSFANTRDFIDADNDFTDANAHAGVSVHWAAEATYDYFLSQHNRRSYNNANATIRSYAHFDNNWFNARWDGSRMLFGDGTNNATPLVTVDVVAHEFTHGVTQFSAGLIYASESGALNESFSDIFGNAVEFATPGATADWSVGEGAIRLRSMSNPRAFGDPNTYLGAGWAPTANPSGNNDNGGVHTNSGVQNYWFYLLSEGGSGVNDNGDTYSVAGLGLERAADIAYRNLTTYLTPSSGYQDARLATIYSTMDLYGLNTPEYQTALAVWEAVGVYYPKLEATLIAATDTLGFLAESAVAKDTSTLVISNFGIDNLSISAIALSGASFQLLAPPALPVNLAYGVSLNLQIIFTPATPSVEFGTVTLTSNDPENATASVTLRGKGFAIRPAQIGVVYAIAGRSEQGVFLTLDQSQGQGTVVGATGYDELTGLALRPSNNIIYGTIATSASTTLMRVDAETGEAYPVAVIPVSNLRAIAFDRNDDLYGVQFTTGGKLYRIDLASGDTTLVGNTNLTLLSGLAINPLDGTLWASRVSQAIYKIDKTTAATTLVGNSGIAETADLEFDAAGNLFGLAGFAPGKVSDFLQINPTTGKAVKLGTTGFKSVYSLIIRGTITTAVAEQPQATAPRIFALAQNHPNPFNPSTEIAFSLPNATLTTLKVYDLAGREVATLINGKMAAGEHRVKFEANALAAGVYLYRLQAGEQVAVRKLVLVK